MEILYWWLLNALNDTLILEEYLAWDLYFVENFQILQSMIINESGPDKNTTKKIIIHIYSTLYWLLYTQNIVLKTLLLFIY